MGFVRQTTAVEYQTPPTPPSEAIPTKFTHTEMTSKNGTITPTNHQHIWIVTGPAGSGKTSVAEYIANKLSLPYLEGDTFHPPENVKKMAEGHPLTDADRWDWLVILREEALKALATGSSGVLVTCSALKRKYRDVMRVASYHHPDVQVHFVFLEATEALLMDRVRARKGHYMKDSMVHSQFESLETPQTDEFDILSVDASGTSEVVQELALEMVRKSTATGPSTA